jgi:hypothetical protein
VLAVIIETQLAALRKDALRPQLPLVADRVIARSNRVALATRYCSPVHKSVAQSADHAFTASYRKLHKCGFKPLEPESRGRI